MWWASQTDDVPWRFQRSCGKLSTKAQALPKVVHSATAMQLLLNVYSVYFIAYRLGWLSHVEIAPQQYCKEHYFLPIYAPHTRVLWISRIVIGGLRVFWQFCDPCWLPCFWFYIHTYLLEHGFQHNRQNLKFQLLLPVFLPAGQWLYHMQDPSTCLRRALPWKQDPIS